jgi:hypothetical protein
MHFLFFFLARMDDVNGATVEQRAKDLLEQCEKLRERRLLVEGAMFNASEVFLISIGLVGAASQSARIPRRLVGPLYGFAVAGCLGSFSSVISLNRDVDKLDSIANSARGIKDIEDMMQGKVDANIVRGELQRSLDGEGEAVKRIQDAKPYFEDWISKHPWAGKTA